ncbi:WD40-repeat-containing domain protein [Trichoderma pleuroticola]
MWLKRRLPFVSSPSTTTKYWSSNFAVFQGHDDWVRCTAFSPNGQFLASSSDDSSVRIWDTATGTTQHKLKIIRCWIYCVTISIKGIVAAGSDDGSITLWDMATGVQLRRLSHYSGTIRSLDFSGCGDKLAVATSSDVRIWDLNTFKHTDLDGPQDAVASVSFSADSKWLVAGIDDGNVGLWDVTKIWNTREAQKAEPDIGVDIPMTGVERAAPQTIATDKEGSNSGNDAASVKPPIITIYGHDGTVNCVTFSPNSKLIASSADDGTVRIWDVDDNGIQNNQLLSAGHGAVNSVAFSPNDDGSRLAACMSHVICIWDTKAKTLLQMYRSPSLTLLSLAFSPDGTYLATGSLDGNIHLWSTFGRSDIKESAKENEGQQVTEMALSPDGQTLATAHGEGSVHLWNIKDNSRIETKMAFDHERTVQSLMFSPRDGSRLLSASADRTVRICNVATGARTSLFRGHADWVRFATWSPDEEYVASASDDGSIRIWKLEGQNDVCLETLRPSSSILAWGVAYSSDQKFIAACGSGSKIGIWERNPDDQAWMEKHLLAGQDSSIANIVFTPGRHQLASSSSNGITIWNIETGEILNRISLKTHQNLNTKLWFDSDLPSYVITSYGAQYLESTQFSENPVLYPYRIVLMEDGSKWIKWHNQEAIFLPKDISFSNSIIARCTIILGGDSGDIYVFKLSETFLT